MQKGNQTTWIVHKVGSHPCNLPHLAEYIKHRKQSNFFFYSPGLHRDQNNVYKSYLWLGHENYISATG